MSIRILFAACLLTSAPMFSEFPPSVKSVAPTPIERARAEIERARAVATAAEAAAGAVADEASAAADAIAASAGAICVDDAAAHAPINVGLNYAAIIAEIDEEANKESSRPTLSDDELAEIDAIFASQKLSVAGSWDDKVDLPSNAYPGVYHYWIECAPDASWFRLEDGSRWYIRYADRNKISRWHMSYRLVLRLNSFSDSDKYYQYQLYNTITDEAIQVNLYEGPLLGGVNTVAIAAFASNGYEFRLTNGSIWDVRLSDCDNMIGWNAGDCVYVVPNEDLWTRYFYSYRVVNIARKRHVRANWKS